MIDEEERRRRLRDRLAERNGEEPQQEEEEYIEEEEYDEETGEYYPVQRRRIFENKWNFGRTLRRRRAKLGMILIFVGFAAFMIIQYVLKG